VVAAYMPFAFGQGGSETDTSCVPAEPFFFHFDKVVFRPADNVQLVDSAGKTYFFKDRLEIKIQDFPTVDGATTIVRDMRATVANCLNGAGWIKANGQPVNQNHIFIEDVEYAIWQLPG
jgi:hypothetical protein